MHIDIINSTNNTSQYDLIKKVKELVLYDFVCILISVTYTT